LTRAILLLFLAVAAGGIIYVFRTLQYDDDGSRRDSNREAAEDENAWRRENDAPPAEQPKNEPARGKTAVYRAYGFVLDSAERPVPGARVTATPLNGGESVTATTNREGGYELDLSYFAATFDVVAAGYLPHVGTREFTIEGREPNRRDFKLKRAAVLAGRVTDAAGVPVTGAAVYRIHAEHQLVEKPSLANVTYTDERGEYAFPGVPAGVADLGVRAAGFLPALTRDVRIEGLREVRQEFTLQRGRTVKARVDFKRTEELVGRVVASDSRLREKLIPPGGIELLRDALVGRTFIEFPVVSALQGEDSIALLAGLPAGPVDLEVQVVSVASGARHDMWIAEPGLGKLIDNGDAEVVLRPLLASQVAPTVVDARTRDVLRPRITRTADDAGPFPLDAYIGSKIFLVPVDQRRHVLRFELDGYQPEEYVMPFERDDPHDIAIEMQPLTDNATGTIRIVFDREMKGRVGVVGRGEAGGRQWHATGPDSEGRWLVEKVPPGTWELTILSTGMIPAKVPEVTVVAGTTQEVRVAISPGGGMELRVEGPDGNLLDKVTLDLRDPDNQQIDIHFVTMVSGKRGFTSINYIPSAATAKADSGLAAGTYTLFAGREGYAVGKGSFVLHGNEVGKITIKLERE